MRDTSRDGEGPPGGGRVLLRCGMKPGGCRHIHGTAVGVQGSATDPALTYTGPTSGMCRPWGRAEWKGPCSSQPSRKEEQHSRLDRRMARREEKAHRAGGARRKQGANVDLTQSYQ